MQGKLRKTAPKQKSEKTSDDDDDTVVGWELAAVVGKRSVVMSVR